MFRNRHKSTVSKGCIEFMDGKSRKRASGSVDTGTWRRVRNFFRIQLGREAIVNAEVSDESLLDKQRIYLDARTFIDHPSHIQPEL